MANELVDVATELANDPLKVGQGYAMKFLGWGKPDAKDPDGGRRLSLRGSTQH